MNYLVVIWLLCVQYIYESNGYYYWTDYYNKILPGAYSPGMDVKKEKIYIGQVFIKSDPHQGIYPATIVRGEDVYAPIYGAKKADNFVQILCSTNPEYFEWIPTNATHFHLLETDNELIRGGVEDDHWLNIGRLKYQGGTVIGKVVSGQIGNAEMWFVHNGNEIKAQVYEVLTYNDLSKKINVRITGS